MRAYVCMHECVRNLSAANNKPLSMCLVCFSGHSGLLEFGSFPHQERWGVKRQHLLWEASGVLSRDSQHKTECKSAQRTETHQHPANPDLGVCHLLLELWLCWTLRTFCFFVYLSLELQIIRSGFAWLPLVFKHSHCHYFKQRSTLPLVREKTATTVSLVATWCLIQFL